MLHANENTVVGSVTITDIRDGTSKTIITGEVTESNSISPTATSGGLFPIWAGGNNNGGCNGINGGAAVFRFIDTNYWINRISTDAASDQTFRSLHPGGAQFGLVDGGTRFISETVDIAVYVGMGTRAGRESTGIDQ